jgi:Mg-chelatase subunit ChlD
LLEQSSFGYTNLEHALRTSYRDLNRSRRHGRRVGLLITDGKITAGGDPLPLASSFDALHVIMTEDLNMDREMCRQLAAAGHGRLLPLYRFESLPRLIYGILRAIAR